MFYAFFALAAQSPTRQKSFRWLVAAHLLILTGACWHLGNAGLALAPLNRTLLGHLLLITGIVEGGMLIGWRLTQMPKSQALEFILVSSLRPHWLLIAEALVGLAQLALVTLAGLPVLLVLVSEGFLDPLDPVPLLLVPLTWGAVTGLGLTVWAYEPLFVRRLGERVALLLIVFDLVVGVLAGENLKSWLSVFSDDVEVFLLRSFYALHTHNPFGVLSNYLENNFGAAWERVAGLQLFSTMLIGLLMWRAARRLQGHFHELHYQPARDVANERRPRIVDTPLTWWAVKRVSRYSGRINLWLGGGFGCLYALYTVAGPHWPPWLGKSVFEVCDRAGGVAGLTTCLVLLATVPAAFQYGLWDSNAQDRCRRLELLLLTDLRPHDYWNAAAAAAWKRGRGYFAVALLLWAAAAFAGQIGLGQFAVAVAVAVLVWALYFALGFRAFSRGMQANGLGLSLTVGLPVLTLLLYGQKCPLLGSLLPPGLIYCAGTSEPTVVCLLAPLAIAGCTLFAARHSLLQCDAELRRWYDRNHGSKLLS